MISSVDPKVASAVLDKAAASASTRTTGVHYIGAADTAKLIRSALKIAFPGVKFSVKSDSYSGGSSIDVAWTDGPAKAKVDTALGGFVGRGFDGSIDLGYSSDCYITRAGSVGFAKTDGTAGSLGYVPDAVAPVPFGAAIVSFGSYIFTNRSFSPAVTVPDGRTDYWAWKALNDSDLPAALPPKH